MRKYLALLSSLFITFGVYFTPVSAEELIGKSLYQQTKAIYQQAIEAKEDDDSTQ